MVREYIEIGTVGSIEALIQRLEEVKAAIPSGAGPEQVRMRGDDNFGRHILITYLRPERPEERALVTRGAIAAGRLPVIRGEALHGCVSA
jgi:hypothetical protein